MAFKTMAESIVATEVPDLQNAGEDKEHVQRIAAKANPCVSKPIPVSAFESIEAEEFCEGSGKLSLWLVPTGYVYDPYAQSWVQGELDDC